MKIETFKSGRWQARYRAYAFEPYLRLFLS